ncbi:MAG TPA: FAD binding domain-containing protein [Casimicrobiaceae bacterium]
MNRFEWSSPSTVAAAQREPLATTASRMAAHDASGGSSDAVLMAGGIDVVGLMKDRLLAPSRVVSLRGIAELGRIEDRADGSLGIGANVTLAAIADDPRVRAHHRALADAAGRSASRELRAVATIGGNLLQRPRCWYFRSPAFACARKGGGTCFAFRGDNRYHAIFDHHGCAMVHPSTPATALVALGAHVELAGRSARRRLALESFLIGTDQSVTRENDLEDAEILTHVVLPAPVAGRRSAHQRVGEVASFDWPLADVAAVLDFDASGACSRASIVLGAAAPTPHRAREAERALAGRALSPDVAKDAARAALAQAAPLSGNAYKVPIFEAIVARTILEAAGRA